VRVFPLSEDDAPRLLDLYEAAADYHHRVGSTPDAAGVAQTLAHPSSRHGDVGPGLEHVVYGVTLRETDRLDGVVAVLLGYPTPTTAYVGLLLLRPEIRRHGLGVALLDWLEAALPPAFTTLRLAVHHNNPDAARFWRRQGFVVQPGASSSPESDVYERPRRVLQR
jgi:ribosomal protein S18 acetylase RimI-like enzyme